MKSVVLMALLGAAAAAPLLKPEGPEVPTIPDEYIVVLHKGMMKKKVANHHTWLNTIDGIRVDHVYSIGTFHGYAGKFTEEALQMILERPDVAYVEPNGYAHIVDTQTSPPSYGQDRVDQRNLPLNQKYIYHNSSGSGVDAYVIDTGIYVSHNDFEGRAIWGNNFVGDGRNDDCNGHGTHVSGTIAGKKFGLTKSSNLIAVKVLGCGGSGAWSGVIAGLDWVTQRHLASATKRSVANMSLGGSKIQSVNDATTASVNAGVSHAVAAGNNAGNACNYSPASTPEAVTVGATDSADRVASYSNHGNCLDIWAPGSNILSCWIGNPDATATLSGTSMASPHIAGAIAQHLGESSSHTPPATVTKRLQDQSTKNVITGVPAGTLNYFVYTEPPAAL